MEQISLMKIRSLARLSVCSNQTGFSLPDSMTSATRMVAEDSLVWDMVAMVGKLPYGNHGASRDIVVGAAPWRGITTYIHRHAIISK